MSEYGFEVKYNKDEHTIEVDDNLNELTGFSISITAMKSLEFLHGLHPEKEISYMAEQIHNIKLDEDVKLHLEKMIRDVYDRYK